MSGDDRTVGHGRFESQELDELLGAYALDAVTEDERRAIDEYLRVNPRARAEVEEHREVASLLAWSGTPAPEGLWDKIASSLEEAPPEPKGELAAVLALDEGRRARDERKRSPWAGSLTWVASAAAAVLATLLVVSFVDDDQPTDGLAAAVDEAREDEGAMVATLTSADGQSGGEVIIDGEGHGFLVAEELPELSQDRTWQLWGVVDGEAISLGILGHSPAIETFTVRGAVTQVVVTNEVAGGVITNGNPDGAFAGALSG